MLLSFVRSSSALINEEAEEEGREEIGKEARTAGVFTTCCFTSSIMKDVAYFFALPLGAEGSYSLAGLCGPVAVPALVEVGDATLLVLKDEGE